MYGMNGRANSLDHGRQGPFRGNLRFAMMQLQGDEEGTGASGHAGLNTWNTQHSRYREQNGRGSTVQTPKTFSAIQGRLWVCA